MPTAVRQRGTADFTTLTSIVRRRYDLNEPMEGRDQNDWPSPFPS